MFPTIAVIIPMSDDHSRILSLTFPSLGTRSTASAIESTRCYGCRDVHFQIPSRVVSRRTQRHFEKCGENASSPCSRVISSLLLSLMLPLELGGGLLGSVIALR